MTVRYPRGAEAERQHHEQPWPPAGAPGRPRTRSRVVLRLLVAQRLADTAGLPNADRQGIYEPQVLATSPSLASSPVASHRASVAAPGRAAGSASSASRRARRAGSATLQGSATKLAAGESVRCECLPRHDRVAADAIEKHGSLVHAGECEQQWGSAQPTRTEEAAA